MSHHNRLSSSPRQARFFRLALALLLLAGVFTSHQALAGLPETG